MCTLVHAIVAMYHQVYKEKFPHRTPKASEFTEINGVRGILTPPMAANVEVPLGVYEVWNKKLTNVKKVTEVLR
jgi:hypothetical protein